MPKRDVAPVGAPCWIDLSTSDPDKSKAFYGELFGWNAEDAGEEYGGYINFSKDGLPVAGGMRNDGQSGMPDHWSVYLASENAPATVDALDEGAIEDHLARVVASAALCGSECRCLHAQGCLAVSRSVAVAVMRNPNRRERSFGLLVGGVFSALGAWWIYRGKFGAVAPGAVAIGLTLALLCAAAPKLLGKLSFP